MTPTHPPHPSTHRRIADILERAPTSAPSLATALDLTPATIGAALAKMTELGYVAKGDTQSRTIGHGRPTQLWQLAPAPWSRQTPAPAPRQRP